MAWPIGRAREPVTGAARRTRMSRQPMTRRSFLGTATLAMTGVALGPGPVAAAAPKAKVGWIKNQLHHTTFAYVARIADKHGFAVELLDFTRYSDIMLALQKKQVDYGGIGYASLPSIVEQNLDNVRVIAGNMMGAVDMIIRTGVKVETWKDYEGKKIAVPSNSLAEHHVRVNAIEHGYDITKVEIVKMVPGPAALIALKQGEIDGISAWEPWIAQAVVQGIGYVPKIRVFDNSIGPINGVVGASREFVEKNRDVTVRFLRALIEANAYLTANPEEHAKLALSAMSIDRAVALKAIDNFRYDEKIYMKQTRTYAKVMHQYGLTKVDTSERVAETVDWSFLEAATGKPRRELGGQ
jgi:ABC-type nitrate/sulfonate/bicarbonate transport system substrate-binding protein